MCTTLYPWVLLLAFTAVKLYTAGLSVEMAILGDYVFSEGFDEIGRKVSHGASENQNTVGASRGFCFGVTCRGGVFWLHGHGEAAFFGYMEGRRRFSVTWRGGVGVFGYMMERRRFVFRFFAG